MRPSLLLRPAVLLAFLISGAAWAEDLVIPLPEGTTVQRLKTSYSCTGGGPMTVDYVNADGISLALLPVAGRPMVFANVLAASGARYAAGPYVWWEKGGSATLQDLRKGEDAAPLDTCTARP